VRRQAPVPDADPARQRSVVDAFFAAARDGDFEALLSVLDPEIVLREDAGPQQPSAVIRGARAVAGRALAFAHLSPWVRPALVNGTAGVLVAPSGRLFAVMAFTVTDGKVVEIDVLADPSRLDALERSGLA
jgi:RNA polymerase sigma-70 factor (ECF subfamily)